MRKGIKSILWISIILVLISILLCICFKDSFDVNNFFSFSIIDVLSIIFTVLIGIILTYYISLQQKKGDILTKALDEFVESAEEALSAYCNVTNKDLTVEERLLILKYLQMARLNFAVIKKNEQKDKDFKEKVGELKNQLGVFTASLSGDSLVVGKKISIKEMNEAMSSFLAVKNNVIKMKLSL